MSGSSDIPKGHSNIQQEHVQLLQVMDLTGLFLWMAVQWYGIVKAPSAGLKNPGKKPADFEADEDAVCSTGEIRLILIGTIRIPG